MESISKSINEFSFAIFEELISSSSRSNVFLSPTSISAALSLLLLGSKGNTASQIQKVLHYPEDTEEDTTEGRCETKQQTKENKGNIPEQTVMAPECNLVAKVHSMFQVLLSKLTAPINGTELKIANGMFAQTDFPFLKQYLGCAQLLYQAKLETVDFKKDKTREEINKWVESVTQGKIKNLFDKQSLDQNTVLALVSAIYFKGKWSKLFPNQNTKDSSFYVNKEVVKFIPMMFQSERLNLGEIKELNAHILELPYQEEKLSMFILLTNEKFGLEKIEHQISFESLAKGMKNLKKQKVDVHLPRFRLEESIDLGTHLVNMGMVDAFSPEKANLSGLSDVPLYVSKVVHKAFVEVNEEGTEAAAATGVGIVPKMAEHPYEFNANHPFLFLIRHNETGTILFYGKFSSP